MSIQPSRDQGRALLKLPKDKPVVMVNLLRYKAKTGRGDETGKEAYQKYMENMEPLLKQAGGELVYAGNTMLTFIGDPERSWDQILMVRYPSPRHFMKMSSSDEYQKLHVDREAALEDTELIVSHEIE